MNVWLENSIKNIFPLSKESHDFTKAIAEWSFTGRIIDHEMPIELCELCEKDQLRYHYEISNDLQNVLWVGSKCIDKFDIKVFDEFGNEISEGKAAYLGKLVKERHVKSIYEQLIKTSPEGKIGFYPKKQLDSMCYTKFLKKEISAKVINYVFLRCQEEGIRFDPKSFSISIRSEYNKRKLLELGTTQFERIKPALSIAQINYYKENKYLI